MEEAKFCTLAVVSFAPKAMGRHPEVKWAQRSDKVFVTVELPDAKNPKVKIEPEGKFSFLATVGPENGSYELDMELFEKVNVEDSKISTGLRNVVCVLQKNEKGWWKRLLKAEGKPPPYLKVDWDKWVDEDEENESSNKFDNLDLGSMDDFSSFNMDNAMGGMEDLGDDEPDSDNEDAELNATKTAEMEDTKSSVENVVSELNAESTTDDKIVEEK